MPGPATRICISRSEGAILLKAGDFVYHPPRQIHDFIEYSDDVEISALAGHGAVDV